MKRGPHLYVMIETGIDRKLNELATLTRPRTTHVPRTQLVSVVVTRVLNIRRLLRLCR